MGRGEKRRGRPQRVEEATRACRAACDSPHASHPALTLTFPFSSPSFLDKPPDCLLGSGVLRDIVFPPFTYLQAKTRF
jgi:hypothetical protein